MIPTFEQKQNNIRTMIDHLLRDYEITQTEYDMLLSFYNLIVERMIRDKVQPKKKGVKQSKGR
jgi:hypothetical protein